MNEKTRTNAVGGLTLVGVAFLCIGAGAAFGWPFGLMAAGAFALLLAIGAP